MLPCFVDRETRYFMQVAALLLTHLEAQRLRKSPFFFSLFNFERMKRRGNTHYCFDCGGQWGFTPDKKGEATKCADDPMLMRDVAKYDYLRNRDVVSDETLVLLLDTNIHNPNDYGYSEWLDSAARFLDSPSLEKVAQEKELTVYSYNAMRSHDPKTHRNAVVGKAHKFRFAREWLIRMIPRNFPYVVSLH